MLTWNRHELAAAARLLSYDQADVEVRRQAENLLARTSDAVWLYRVREIQFAVTIAEALQDGDDACDLHMPWLRVRDPDVPLEAWRAFDESLVDAPVAVDRWWDAGKLWQDLVTIPREAVDEWIREIETCDNVLVTRPTRR